MYVLDTDLNNAVGQVLIASFSEARNQKNRKVSLSVLLSYGTGLTIAIIRIAI